MNYYNEIDPFAAKWLRELIKAGHISRGEVDERSIEDVKPTDLRGYKQCHFFAGIGVWSYALRQAGWPDDREVWTGSCPCQPFSAAGKRGGTADERHLWPALYWLIKQCSPRVVFGEQVSSKDGLAWFNSVQADLEAKGYAVGGLDLCAAGFGAPHIRQRLYFVGQLAHSDGRYAGAERVQRGRQYGQQSQDSGVSPLDNSSSKGLEVRTSGAVSEGQTLRQPQRPSDVSFWGAHDEIGCIDGRKRPVEPSTFPLVDGSPNRVGRLRGYGNALCAPVAQAFIEAYLESE